MKSSPFFGYKFYQNQKKDLLLEKVIPTKFINYRDNLQFFTLKQLFRVGIHFGTFKRFWDYQVSFFYFGLINKIILFDLSFTLSFLRRTLYFTKEVYKKGGHILFVTKDYLNRGIPETLFKFAPYLSIVKDKWMGGTLTNIKRIRAFLILKLRYLNRTIFKRNNNLYNKYKDYYSFVRMINIVPSGVFLLKLYKEHWVYNESLRLKIPLLGIVNEKSSLHFDYLIPSELEGTKTMFFFSFVLRNNFIYSFLEKFLDLDFFVFEKCNIKLSFKNKKLFSFFFFFFKKYNYVYSNKLKNFLFKLQEYKLKNSFGKKKYNYRNYIYNCLYYGKFKFFWKFFKFTKRKTFVFNNKNIKKYKIL